MTAATDQCWGGYYCPEGLEVPNPAQFLCPQGLHCPNGSEIYKVTFNGSLISVKYGKAICIAFAVHLPHLPVVLNVVMMHAVFFLLHAYWHDRIRHVTSGAD